MTSADTSSILLARSYQDGIAGKRAIATGRIGARSISFLPGANSLPISPSVISATGPAERDDLLTQVPRTNVGHRR